MLLSCSYKASFLALSVFLAAWAHSSEAPIDSPNNTITFSYWDQASEPFVFLDNEQLTGGIIKQIGDAISQHLGLKANYIRLPVARIEPHLKSGKVDADCVTSPIWKETPEDYAWSPVLFEGSDRFLIKQGSKNEIRMFSDLKNKRLGIYNGYVYHPEIMRMLNESIIIPVKIKDLPKGIELLKLGRLDTLIDLGILIQHQIKKQGLENELALSEMHADDFSLSCALSKASKIPVEAFNEAVKKLTTSDKMTTILSAYK